MASDESGFDLSHDGGAEGRADGGETAPDAANAPRAQDANSSSNARGVEHIDVDEPLHVAAIAAMLETTKGPKGGERRPAGVEHIDEDADYPTGPPSPPGSFAYALGAGSPKGSPQRAPKQAPEPAGEASTGTSVRGPGGQDDDLQFTTISSPRYLQTIWGGRPEGAQDRSGGDEEASVNTIDFEASEDAAGGRTSAPNASVYASADNGIPVQVGGDSVPGITEAYAVHDEVIMAEPTVPMWKQRKVRLLLALFLAALAVLAIALGVTLSRDQPPVTQMIGSDSTPAPSISSHPTVSLVPSSSPTECSDTVGSNKQKIDLLSPDAEVVRTAVDGPNLVVAYIVASRYNEFGKIGDGAFYIEFYKLQNEGTWQRVHFSVERNLDWKLGYAGYVYFDLALSGKTAVIGLPSRDDMEGAVHVYRESGIGTWERVVSPEPSSRIGECRFGESVDIDGALLVVSDKDVCVREFVSLLTSSPNGAYIFKQVGDEWKEVAGLGNRVSWGSFGEIAVEGDTIAYDFGDDHLSDRHVEVYSPQNESALDIIKLPEQSHANIKTLAMSGNHLVSSAGPEGYWVYDTPERDSEIWYEPVESVLIYQREGAGQQYTLLQTLNSSDYDEGFGQAFDLDADLLVVSSSNQTHIFSQQPDGAWEETLTLDESYSHYQLSGRTLIAADQNEVYSMDIAGCTQALPTQMSSISSAPTTFECFWINVTIVTMSNINSGLWEAAIQTRDLIASDSTNIVTYSDETDDSWEDQLWMEKSTCLRPGQYQFTFHGEGSRFTDRHYRVESNGLLIAQEKVSLSYGEIDNVHPFDIPFIARDDSPTGPPLPPRPAPLTRPSATPAPSTEAVAATGPSPKICQTRSECEGQMQSGEYVSFYTGTFAEDFGCFSKGGNLFWGTGGSEEQMTASPLAGAKERVWC
ncbi:hypothetical protein ACHAXT_005051 [Thalassiosira profunda]